MQKNKFILGILILTIAFSTFFSFSVSNATITFDGRPLEKREIVNNLRDLQTKNGFEMALSGIALNVGDMIIDFSTFIFKDEITIDRLIFNKVPSLNANFFDNKGMVPDTTEVLIDVINNWYSFFRGIGILIYLIVLIVIGIKIMLGMAQSVAEAKELIVKWTIGIGILFLFPYVIKYSFIINESIINSIRSTFTNNNPYEEIIGSYIGNISDIQFDQVFEYRSPAYISSNEYVYSLGSEEATFAYFSQLEKYRVRGDVMRVMRSLAGITGRFIYVILWYIMLGQLLVLIFVYLKRYLMIAFLLIIFPIVVIEHIIGVVKTGKGGGFSTWCMEFFLNVFIQTIHAIIYGIIGGVVTAHVQNGIMSGNISKMNWVILIISINFIFEAENIFKKIIKANATTLENSSDVSKKLKGMRKKIVKF